MQKYPEIKEETWVTRLEQTPRAVAQAQGSEAWIRLDISYFALWVEFKVGLLETLESSQRQCIYVYMWQKVPNSHFMNKSNQSQQTIISS